MTVAEIHQKAKWQFFSVLVNLCMDFLLRKRFTYFLAWKKLPGSGLFV